MQRAFHCQVTISQDQHLIQKDLIQYTLLQGKNYLIVQLIMCFVKFLWKIIKLNWLQTFHTGIIFTSTFWHIILSKLKEFQPTHAFPKNPSFTSYLRSFYFPHFIFRFIDDGVSETLSSSAMANPTGGPASNLGDATSSTSTAPNNSSNLGGPWLFGGQMHSSLFSTPIGGNCSIGGGSGTNNSSPVDSHAPTPASSFTSPSPNFDERSLQQHQQQRSLFGNQCQQLLPSYMSYEFFCIIKEEIIYSYFRFFLEISI